MTTALLKDRYELLRKLGSGGFSTVFAAMDTLLDREVAIKILKASLHEDEELVTRFLLEAKLTSKLTHPNALTVHDFGRDEQGHCFFVTELLMGQSLHDRLYTKTLTLFDSLSIIKQIASALGEAHSKDIVHRDIKPGNIFLCKSSTPSPQKEIIAKLLDFGIAKSVGFDGQTVTGQMMGTPTYMSPEQIVNIKEVDQRTDIYSLGIVFYHMICGSPPFKGDSYFDTMRMHMQAPLPPLNLKTRHQNVYQALTDLLVKMTAKDKQSRHEHAHELIDDINKIQTLVLRITTRSAAQKSVPTTAQSSSSQTENSPVSRQSIPNDLSVPQSSSKEISSSKPQPTAKPITSSAEQNEPIIKTAVLGANSAHSVPSSTEVQASSSSSSLDSFNFEKSEDNLTPSYGWRESLKENSISENPLEFLKEVEANNLDLPPPLDPFAIKVADSQSNSSNDLVISSASSSIKLKVPTQASHKVTMTEEPAKADNFELKTTAMSSSASVQMNQSAKPQSTSRTHQSPQAQHQQGQHKDVFGAGRDDHLSVLAPSAPRVIRILILDPNQFASQLYQKGLMAGAERRSKNREAKGISSSDMLTVTLSNTLESFKEDLDWGADVVLADLKAQDGHNESEGIELIRELKKQIPSNCHLIALCKDVQYADDALLAGADRVLMKPVRNRQLFDAIAYYLWPTSL